MKKFETAERLAINNMADAENNNNKYKLIKLLLRRNKSCRKIKKWREN